MKVLKIQKELLTTLMLQRKNVKSQEGKYFYVY